MRLGDIEDPHRFLSKVIQDLGIEPRDRDLALSIGLEQLVEWDKRGGSLRRIAAGMIGKRILDGLRREWSYRERVTSLDELEAELDEDGESRFQPVATYGPELVDQIASADALAVFQGAEDFRSSRKIGQWVNGSPSHRPAPPMRAREAELARQHELRLLGRYERFKL
jgi:hypothetical protein